MKYPVLSLAVSMVLLGVVGCDATPPPPRVPVPAMGQPGPDRYDPVKPVPGQMLPPQPIPYQAPNPIQPPPNPIQPPPAPIQPQAYVPQPKLLAAPPAEQIYQTPPEQPQGAFNDQPLLKDRPPEQRAFVDAYNRVGRPKFAIYVNRTLQGQAQQVGGNGVPVPGNTPPDLNPANINGLDYEAIEAVLTDWLSAGGQTVIVSHSLAEARLTREQQQALETGQAFVLTDITQRLDADILILVHAQPSAQNSMGPQVRLVGEAINVRGGQSIGRALVDMPQPLDKPTINEYTRFVARKLMDDMAYTWSVQPPAPPPGMQSATPPPAQAPAPPTPPK